MFSGKTDELVRRLRRAQIAKLKVVVFKPHIDDRHRADVITSHSGSSLTAVAVETVADIWDQSKDAQVVGIDEVQFFPNDLVEVIQNLARAGKRVICSGLDMDYRGSPFGPVPELLAVCEYPTKLQAVCTTCGAPASMSQRISDSTEKVMVGGASAYEARCRKHWSPQPVFAMDNHMDRMED